MADRFIQGETLSNIADAIRLKTGGMSLLKPAQMITAIGTLTKPSGTLTVSRDGEFDVKSYLEIVVQTGGSGPQFSYGFNYDTGELTIIDPDNPLPEEPEEI